MDFWGQVGEFRDDMGPYLFLFLLFGLYYYNFQGHFSVLLLEFGV